MLRDEGCANNNICCLVHIGRNICYLITLQISLMCPWYYTARYVALLCHVCYIAMSVFVVLHVIDVVLKAMRVVLFCRELCANRFTFLGPC